MVEYLTIQGRDYPVRISYYVLKRVQEDLKKKGKKDGLASLDVASLDFETLESMLFYSLKRGAMVEKTEMPFVMQDMEEVMDEVFTKFTKLIPKFFKEEDENTDEKKEEDAEKNAQ